MNVHNDVKYAVQLLFKYPDLFGKELNSHIDTMTDEQIALAWHALGGLPYLLGVKHTANIRRKFGG